MPTLRGAEEATRQAWADALLAPLWESAAHRPTAAPRAAHRWRWEDVRRHAHAAAALTSPEVVERRVLRLVNPDPVSPGDESTVGNLAAAIQILLPGETARPHRHSINALRFILEGEGATTFVNGESVAMHAGDMLLTAGDCWHEHRHDGAEPVIWLDALDAPLHAALGTVTFQPGPIVEPPAVLPQGTFAASGLLPVETGPAQPYSPQFRYAAAGAAAALAEAPRGADGTRAIRFVNPLTGGATMPTIDLRMVALDAGKRTPETRSTANAICLVVEGEGESWVGDRHFAWSRHDIMSFPQKSWVRHQAHSPARLFLISDREALRRLDLLEETSRA